MALRRRKYPSKLLLFGEYGVLLGLDALAIPFREFTGKLEKTGDEVDEHLLAFNKHLHKASKSLPYNINLERFEKDIERGLRFNSEIPLNYGLGSSGALVAAIFENYFEPKNKKQKTDLRALKTTLALLESHFHGISSGIDPLVSLVNMPVLVRKSGGVSLMDKSVLPSKRKLRFFLIDSNTPGKTGDMVTQFMDKMNEAEFSENFRTAYQLYSNGAIRNLINRDYVKFEENFRSLSEFQLHEMNELIPTHVQELFQKGLNSKLFSLKVCGSGGGGFFMGITHDKTALQEELNVPLIFF